jgi:glycosyltransferase involved in cell wall biosynthesis
MGRPRFYFIEPSKVDNYHITLIEGYLRAICASENLAANRELVVRLSESTFARLSSDLQHSIRNVQIPVVSQDKRQLVRKTLVEFYVVMKHLVVAKANDIVFVSSLIPTTLLLLEIVNRVWRKPVFVVVHGEVEAIFGPRPRGLQTFAYWAYSWFAVRSISSTIRLVVIAEFIREKIHQAFPRKLPLNQIWVVPHPITAMDAPPAPQAGATSLCFIGHRTSNKGFDVFLELSKRHPELCFVAIGGGYVEDLGKAKTSPISDSSDYLREISRCAVAVFPYTGGYSCSLSAAVLDALSAGVHILATARACFLSLAADFGPDFVTIYESPADIDRLIARSDWLEERRSGQLRRLSLLEKSNYGLDAVRASFERLALAPI